MKFIYLMLLCGLCACEYAQPTTHSTIPNDPPQTPVDFAEWVNRLNPMALPDSTKGIHSKGYQVEPFDATIPFFNQPIPVTDLQTLSKKLEAQIPCFYHNDCSISPPNRLKENCKDRLASQFCAARVDLTFKNGIILLAKSRFTSQDAYLLVYSLSGQLLSALQVEGNCSNKVGAFKRRSFLDKQFNIFVTDFQYEAECDAPNFKIKYHYKINTQGKITKVAEKVQFLDDVVPFSKFKAY